MTTKRGRMATDRPERYARQLASHWAAKTTQAHAGEEKTLTFDTGNVVSLRPGPQALEIEISVPAGGDLDRFAEVVAQHLERFGQRDELTVEWS